MAREVCTIHCSINDSDYIQLGEISAMYYLLIDEDGVTSTINLDLEKLIELNGRIYDLINGKI